MDTEYLVGEGWCLKELQQSINRGMFYVWAEKPGTVCLPGRKFRARIDPDGQALPRVLDTLKTRAGLGRVLACVGAGTKLHGTSDNNPGIMESRILVLDFGSDSFTKPVGPLQRPQLVSLPRSSAVRPFQSLFRHLGLHMAPPTSDVGQRQS